MNGAARAWTQAVFASLKRPSLVRRLILLAAAWSLALLLAAGLSLSAFFTQVSIERFDDELATTVDSLLASATVEAGSLLAPRVADPGSQRAYSGVYWEIAEATPAGGLQALQRSRSLWDHALTLPPGGLPAIEKKAGGNLYYDSVGPLQQPLRVAAQEVRLPDIAAPLVFMAALDRAEINRDIRTFDTTIAVTLISLGLGLILAVFIQVRVGLRPLFALRREVADLRTGRSDKVSGRYPSELEPLAVELNALMAHTQETVERQRTHVGNLAHALKTPLSVMLTEAGQQPGALAEVVARQAETMRHQVDHHLRRARAAARAQSGGERTAVAPVLDELSRTLEKIFRGEARSIEWDCDPDLAFHGERQDLLEIVGNVMENACKWRRSRVRVKAGAATPGRLAITIEDDGPGLARDQRAEVLRRGARLDESAPGSGLGLSIVDELVRAYGGEMRLGASALGGLAVEIVLPRAE